jgi:hypothetical protein
MAGLVEVTPVLTESHEQLAKQPSSPEVSEATSGVASLSTTPPSSVGDNQDGDNAAAAQHIDYPASFLKLEDRHIDEDRNLRVTVIGAGIAGITAAILLPAKVPGVRLTVLEKNNEVVSLRNVLTLVRCF